MFVALIAIILTLILVVGVHEAGHALAARFFGVKIKQVSIGFGKPLFRWQKKSGYDLVWALWPLGGYVALLNSRTDPVDPKLYPYCFDKQPFWVRICILLAGSFANLVLAWLAFVFVLLLGMSYKLPVIQSVQPDSIASKAGALVGDQFIAVGQNTSLGWRDVGMQLIRAWGEKDVLVTVKTANTGATKILHFDLSNAQFKGRDANLLSSIGITPDPQAKKAFLRYTSIIDAVQQANKSIVQIVSFFMIVLKQLFTGVIPFSVLLGPIGLLDITINSLSQGFVVFMYFIAILSLSVAVTNLFPIPVLDGGSIIYSIIEKIRGKPVSIALELLIHRLFLIGFFVLLVHLLMNDLHRIYT